jgi:hypothetical protein
MARAIKTTRLAMVFMSVPPKVTRALYTLGIAALSRPAITPVKPTAVAEARRSMDAKVSRFSLDMKRL